jgi:hypothetical protein
MARQLGKNSKQGTSAPKLVTVWAGLVDLMGALQRQLEFEGVRLRHIVVEPHSAVDKLSRPRITSSSCAATSPNVTLIVCVEAKAGEL